MENNSLIPEELAAALQSIAPLESWVIKGKNLDISYAAKTDDILWYISYVRGEVGISLTAEFESTFKSPGAYIELTLFSFDEIPKNASRIKRMAAIVKEEELSYDLI